MTSRPVASIAAAKRPVTDADRAKSVNKVPSAGRALSNDATGRGWSSGVDPGAARSTLHSFGGIAADQRDVARLSMGRPDDCYEAEAERAADAVVTKDPATTSSRAGAGWTPGSSFAKATASVQARAAPGVTPEVTASLPQRMQSAGQEGRPLSDEQRALYEDRLGHDFSAVRIHAGPAAAAAASSVRAQAFTHGHDIYFGQNYYRPNSLAGRRLMAHELAHTVQQRPNVIARRALDDAPSGGSPDPAPSRGADDEGSQPPGAVADQLGSALEDDQSDTSGKARDRLSQLPPSSRRQVAAVLQGRQAGDPSQGEGRSVAAVKPAPPAGAREVSAPSADAAKRDGKRPRQERPGTPLARAAQSGVANARPPSLASGATATPASSPAPPPSITAAPVRQTESKPAPSQRAEASGPPDAARMPPHAAPSSLESPAHAGSPGGGGASNAVGPAGDDARPLRLADLFEQRPEAKASGAETAAGGAAEQRASPRTASSLVPGEQAAGATAAEAGVVSEPQAAEESAAEGSSAAQMEALATDLETALAAAKDELKTKSVTVSAHVRQQAASARAGIRAQVSEAIKSIQAGQAGVLSELSTKVTATHTLIDTSLAARKSEAITAGLTSQKNVRDIFSGHRKSVDDTVKTKIKDAETLRDKKGEVVRQRNQADIKTAYRMGGAKMRAYPGTTRGAYIASAAFDAADLTATKMREQEPEIVSAIKENIDPLPEYFRTEGVKALDGFDVNLPKILASADSGVARTQADQDKRASEAHAQLNGMASQTRSEISSIGLEAVAQAAAFGPQVEGRLNAELSRVLKAIADAPGDTMRRLSPPIEEAITLFRTGDKPDVDAAKALTGGLKGFIDDSIASAADAMEHAAAASTERFQGIHASARQAMHAQLARTNKVWDGSRAGIAKTTGTLHSNFDGAVAGSVSILTETLTDTENKIRDQLSPIVSQIGTSFDDTLHDAEAKIDTRINEGLAKNTEALTDLGPKMEEAAEQAAYEYDHPVLSSIEAGLEFVAGVVVGIIAVLAVVAAFLLVGWIIASVLGVSMLAAGLILLAATAGFAIGYAFAARLDAGQGVGEAFLGAVGDFGRSVPGMLYDMSGIPKLRKAFSDEPMTPYQRGKLIGEGGTELVLAIFVVRGAAKGIAAGFRNLPRFKPPVATPEITALPELTAPRAPPTVRAPSVEAPVELPGKGVGAIEPRPTGPAQVEPRVGVDTAPQPRPSAGPTQAEPRVGVESGPQPRSSGGPTQVEPRASVDSAPQSRPSAGPGPTQAEPRVGIDTALQPGTPGMPSQAEPRIGPSNEGVGAAKPQPQPSQPSVPDNVRSISSAEPGRAGPQPQLRTQRPLTTADEFAARRGVGRPTPLENEPQVQAKPLPMAAGGEGGVVEPIEVGGAPENAPGGGSAMDAQASAKPPRGGPRPLRSVQGGGRSPRPQVSEGAPRGTSGTGGPRGPRAVERPPLEEPAPKQPEPAKPGASSQEAEPAEKPQPDQPSKSAQKQGAAEQPKSETTSKAGQRRSAGDRVTHDKFGDGTVVSEAEGKTTVRFDKGGEKIIRSDYLEPTDRPAPPEAQQPAKALAKKPPARNRPRPDEAARAKERSYIAALKERYPGLKKLDIRPKARPVAGRTEGAPEFAFEERMQTSQGKYSYEVYGADGKPVIEFDGIGDDGWIEEIKINQSESEANIDEIMSNLRRRVEFAKTFGLKGVRYSIDPPSVQFEVESRVAAERLPNTYAVPKGGP